MTSALSCLLKMNKGLYFFKCIADVSLNMDEYYYEILLRKCEENFGEGRKNRNELIESCKLGLYWVKQRTGKPKEY